MTARSPFCVSLQMRRQIVNYSRASKCFFFLQHICIMQNDLTLPAVVNESLTVYAFLEGFGASLKCPTVSVNCDNVPMHNNSLSLVFSSSQIISSAAPLANIHIRFFICFWPRFAYTFVISMSINYMSIVIYARRAVLMT